MEERAKVNHDLHCGSPYQHRVSMEMVGLGVSAGKWEQRLEKTNMTFIVFVFVMHWPSLPPVFTLPKYYIE